MGSFKKEKSDEWTTKRSTYQIVDIASWVQDVCVKINEVQYRNVNWKKAQYSLHVLVELL